MTENESVGYNLAKELWAIYYFMCETYDREVCTGRDHPEFGRLPANAVEARLSQENCDAVHSAIVAISVKENISTEDWVGGKSHAAGLNFEAWKKIAWDSTIYTRVQKLYINIKITANSSGKS